jgi:hypothetical protein
MKRLSLVALVALAGCQGATTPEGCPIYMSEFMRAHTQACVAAYRAEKARQSGQKVTTCETVGNTTTCIEG